MATNNFKIFDENKRNMQTDTEYNSDSQRLQGVQSGVASSKLNNKFAYQVSLVAYAIAQMMNANGINANDTDAVSTFVNNLSASVVQKVVDKATNAQVQAGTDNTKWVTPAHVKAAIQYYTNGQGNNIVSVKHGGTGLSSVPANNFLVGSGMTSNMYTRTPAQVKSLLGVDKIQQQVYPVGTMISSVDPDFPSKMDGEWLPCDGRVIDKEEYPELWNELEYSIDYATALDVDKSFYIDRPATFFINGILYAYYFTYVNETNNKTVTLHVISVNSKEENPVVSNKEITMDVDYIPYASSSSPVSACVSYTNGYYIVSFSIYSYLYFCYSTSPDSGFVSCKLNKSVFTKSSTHSPAYFIFANNRYFIFSSLDSSSSQSEAVLVIDSLDSLSASAVSGSSIYPFISDVYPSDEENKYYVLVTGGSFSDFLSIRKYDFSSATASGNLSYTSAKNSKYTYYVNSLQYFIKHNNYLYYSPAVELYGGIFGYEFVDYYNFDMCMLNSFQGVDNSYTRLVNVCGKLYSAFFYGNKSVFNYVNGNMCENKVITPCIEDEVNDTYFMCYPPKSFSETPNILVNYTRGKMKVIIFNTKRTPNDESTYIKAKN